MDRPSPRRTRRGLILIAAGLLASLSVGTFSLALFTDQAEIGENAFTAGTIVLDATPGSAAIAFADMLPGDIAGGSVDVENNGTGALRYAVDGAATDADEQGLRDVLRLTVKTAGSGCADFDGETLYDGAIGAFAMGDAAMGEDDGDRVLAGGTAETLCFRAELPIETGNAFQGAASTLTMTFSAEQTANN